MAGIALCVLLAWVATHLASRPAESALPTLLVPVALVDIGLFWIAFKVRPPAARMGASVLTPLLVALIGLGGYWYYRSGEAQRSLLDTNGGVVGRAALDRSQYAATLSLFLIAAGLLLVGGRCWRSGRVRSASWSTDLRAGLVPLQARALRHSGGLLLVAIVPVVLLQVGYTPWRMLDRSIYRDPGGISTLFRAGSALSLAGAIVATSVLAMPVSRTHRRLAGAIFATYVIMNFSFATRELALMPLAWLLGRTLARGETPRLRLVLSVAVATVLIYSVPLTLRALDGGHGLLPYASHVASHPSTLVDVDADRAQKNVFQTFGVTGWVGFNLEPIDARYFGLSINPLPSGMIGWDTAAEELKITSYAPYGGVGQLANHGPAYFIGYCLVLGAMLGSVDQAARRVRSSAALVIRILSTGVGALLAFQLIQYHLRSPSRLAGVAFVGAHVIAWVGRRRPRRSDHRDPFARRIRADAVVP